MASANQRSLSQVLGSSLRSQRERRGMRQDELAARMRAIGFEWGQATVSAVEGGRRRLSIEELAVLASVLSVALADLLDSDEVVQLNVTTATPARVVANLIEGGPWKPADHPSTHARTTLTEANARWPNVKGKEAFNALQAAFGDAETKAAKRLGVETIDVALAAVRTWKHGFTEERDARVEATDRALSPRSRQAVRGHVARTMTEELRPVLDKALGPNTRSTTR